MSDTQTAFTLDHPRVQAAKARWDRHSSRGPKQTAGRFERIFGYLQAGMSLSAIADTEGLTRQAMTKKYPIYFREFFGDLSGRERYKAQVDLHHAASIDAAKAELLKQPIMKEVWEAAVAAGAVVDIIPYRAPGRPWKALSNALMVNGHRCQIHIGLRKCRTGKRTRRWSTAIGVCSSPSPAVDAHIVYSGVPGFDLCIFIALHSEIKSAYFAGSGCTARTITIPLEKLPVYRNCRPRFDWWEHQNAWHLLPKKEDEPAP